MKKITKTLSLMILGSMTFSLSSVSAMEGDQNQSVVRYQSAGLKENTSFDTKVLQASAGNAQKKPNTTPLNVPQGEQEAALLAIDQGAQEGELLEAASENGSNSTTQDSATAPNTTGSGNGSSYNSTIGSNN